MGLCPKTPRSRGDDDQYLLSLNLLPWAPNLLGWLQDSRARNGSALSFVVKTPTHGPHKELVTIAANKKRRATGSHPVSPTKRPARWA